MLPSSYSWLSAEGGPRMITEALKEYGVHEGIGTANNPEILGWAKEIGGNVANVYNADSIPWCALFVAVIAQRAGKVLPKDPLWALNWGTFGHHVDIPMLGDVLVFVRVDENGNRAGHVSLYVGETRTTFFILGGNQGDQVCIEEISKTRLYTARRPDYNEQPVNVRQVFLTSTGQIATNEA